MSSILNNLQQALLAHLKNDGALSAFISGRVYETLPRHVTFPYITFADVEARDYSTKTSTGLNALLTLHLWSDRAGMAEIQEMVGALRISLHDASLTLTGGSVARLQEEFAAVTRTTQGHLRQGIVRYRAIVTT